MTYEPMPYKPMFPIHFGWYVQWWRQDGEVYSAGYWWTYKETNRWLIACFLPQEKTRLLYRLPMV